MRQKSIRINKFPTYPNCLNANNHPPKGEWQSIFEKPQNLFLEIGCGKGDFALSVAQQFPDLNVIGVDVKSDRLFVGARAALEQKISNIRFWHQDVYLLGERFNPAEINEIWVTFPDPYPKNAHAHRRMNGPYFLDVYRKLLVPQGIVYFKTDNRELFDFGIESIEQKHGKILYLSHDLHQTPDLPPKAYMLTRYERKFIAEGAKINFVAFQLEKY